MDPLLLSADRKPKAVKQIGERCRSVQVHHHAEPLQRTNSRSVSVNSDEANDIANLTRPDPVVRLERLTLGASNVDEPPSGDCTANTTEPFESQSTGCASSASVSSLSSKPQRRLKKPRISQLLRQLQSDLSPKYMQTSTPAPDTRCSRYGRHQKVKETTDYLANEIMSAVLRKSLSDSGSSPTLRSPQTSATKKSPIEQLSANKADNISTPRTPQSDLRRRRRSRSLSFSTPKMIVAACTSISPIEKLIARNKQAVCMASDYVPALNINNSHSNSSSGSPTSTSVPDDDAPDVADTSDVSPSSTNARSQQFIERRTMSPLVATAARVASFGRAPIVARLAANSNAKTNAIATEDPSLVATNLSAIPSGGTVTDLKHLSQLQKLQSAAYQSPSPRRKKLLPPAPLFNETSPSTKCAPIAVIRAETSPESHNPKQAEVVEYDNIVISDIANNMPPSESEKTHPPHETNVENNEVDEASWTHKSPKTYTRSRRLPTAAAGDAIVQSTFFVESDTESKQLATDSETNIQAVPTDKQLVTIPPLSATLSGTDYCMSIPLDTFSPMVPLSLEALPVSDDIDSLLPASLPNMSTTLAAAPLDANNPVRSPSIDSGSMDSAKGSSIDDDRRSSGNPSSATEFVGGWHAGQLAWARIGKCPYWPCILCETPDGQLQDASRMHVRFLADNGRRSWVTINNLFAFVDASDFERLKKERPKDRKAFNVSKNQRVSWTQAQMEAKMFAMIPIAKRLTVFERTLNLSSKYSKETKRRDSVNSMDISFSSLFSEIVPTKRSSTPAYRAITSALASPVDETMALELVDRLSRSSRSPTPIESPEYEELSMCIEGPTTDDKVQEYLRSMSDQTADEIPSTVPVMSVPTNGSSPDSSVFSETALVSESSACRQLMDDGFDEFYRDTILLGGAVDQPNGRQLEQLALEFWQVRQQRLAVLSTTKVTNKPATKRSHQKKIPLAVNESITSAPLPTSSQKQGSAMANNVRRSLRESRPAPDPNISPENRLKKQPSSTSDTVDRKTMQARRRAEKDSRFDADMARCLIREHPKNILFRGLHREAVCRLCIQPETSRPTPAAVAQSRRKRVALHKCQTPTCQEYVHIDCAIKQRDGLTMDEIADAAVAASAAGTLADPSSHAPRKQKKLVMHVAGDHNEIVLVDADDDDVDHDEDLAFGGDAAEVDIYCPDCWPSRQPVCFVCKATADGSEMRCTEKQCGRHFHEPCLTYWPQNKIVHGSATERQLFCPGHSCHTCISDDPRGKHYRIRSSMLIRCVHCPATYHTNSCCIPAGSRLLTASQLICPRHRVDRVQPLNTNWCFICSKGGELICCETCPMVFHSECLRVQLPDRYICEECETGRLPLYGEIVWAKLPLCRWWPAMTVPPFEIPDRVLAAQRRPHDFAVRYFGTGDYSWVSRAQVFLYQDGDSECKDAMRSSMLVSSGSGSGGASGIALQYQNAIRQAKVWFERLRVVNAQHPNADEERLRQPLPYIKCRTNRPVAPVKLFDAAHDDEAHECECRPSDDDACGAKCLNRMLQIECSARLCRTGAECQNQRFERRAYPSLSERRMEGKGWGLVTNVPIAAGTFVIEYVGELINQQEFDRRTSVKQDRKEEHYYFLALGRELWIDAGPRGNSARFINHSCEPNCETQVWQVGGNQRVGVFALVDIEANTELTFNYNLQSIGDLKKICHCGAKRCAGFIGAKYIDHDEVKRKATAIATKNKAKKRKRTTPTIRLKNANADGTSNKSLSISRTATKPMKRKHSEAVSNDGENSLPVQHAKRPKLD